MSLAHRYDERLVMRYKLDAIALKLEILENDVWRCRTLLKEREKRTIDPIYRIRLRVVEKRDALRTIKAAEIMEIRLAFEETVVKRLVTSGGSLFIYETLWIHGQLHDAERYAKWGDAIPKGSAT